MDQKNSLEGPEATCNLKKQALMLMVVPLNRYKTLREQIDDHLKKEFDVSALVVDFIFHSYSTVYITKILLPKRNI